MKKRANGSARAGFSVRRSHKRFRPAPRDTVQMEGGKKTRAQLISPCRGVCFYISNRRIFFISWEYFLSSDTNVISQLNNCFSARGLRGNSQTRATRHQMMSYIVCRLHISYLHISASLTLFIIGVSFSDIPTFKNSFIGSYVPYAGLPQPNRGPQPTLQNPTHTPIPTTVVDWWTLLPHSRRALVWNMVIYQKGKGDMYGQENSWAYVGSVIFNK